jgi:HD-like signal output (HDOD) protein
MPAPDTAQKLMADLRDRGDLPALDANVSSICSLAGDPAAGAAELTTVILRDCALTACVISTANSAWYHPAEPVKTVSMAILLLGFEKVRALALGLGILKQVGSSAHNRNLHRLFVGAYFAGLFAMGLGRRLGQRTSEELWVAGLLAQLPRLLLAHAFPDRYAALEERMASGKLTLEQACREAFGIDYATLTDEIAGFWHMPASIARVLKSDATNDPQSRALRQAQRLADMLFGNRPGGQAALNACQEEIRALLKDDDFKVNEFVAQTCAEDPNVTRFFQLTPKDVEMMVKIVEWGRVSPSEVAGRLTFGAPKPILSGEPETPASILIGQYLTELMVSLRQQPDINRVLLTAMEAIYRCVGPTCVLLGFLDAAKRNYEGRLYLGPAAAGPATAFRVATNADIHPIQRAALGRPFQFSVRREWPALFQGKVALDAALWMPIVVRGNTVGFCLSARDSATPFSDQEFTWVDALIGHIVAAFERSRPQAGA